MMATYNSLHVTENDDDDDDTSGRIVSSNAQPGGCNILYDEWSSSLVMPQLVWCDVLWAEDERNCDGCPEHCEVVLQTEEAADIPGWECNGYLEEQKPNKHCRNIWSYNNVWERGAVRSNSCISFGELFQLYIDFDWLQWLLWVLFHLHCWSIPPKMYETVTIGALSLSLNYFK